MDWRTTYRVPSCINFHNLHDFFKITLALSSDIQVKASVYDGIPCLDRGRILFYPARVESVTVYFHATGGRRYNEKITDDQPDGCRSGLRFRAACRYRR